MTDKNPFPIWKPISPITFLFWFSMAYIYQSILSYTIQPTNIRMKLIVGSAGQSPCLPLDAFQTNEGEVQGGGRKRKSRVTSVHTEGNPHLHTLQSGSSVFLYTLQPHNSEGSSRQFLINKEHQSSSEDCLQQFGFQTFVEPHYSKTSYSLVQKIENIPKTP